MAKRPSMGMKFKALVMSLLLLGVALVFSPSAAKGPSKCSNPTIEGTQGPDELKGTPRDDVIAARGGRDWIGGMRGADIICAGGGNDKVRGRGGRDELWGGRGNDSIDGDRGRDTAYGHRGDDNCVQAEAFYACL